MARKNNAVDAIEVEPLEATEMEPPIDPATQPCAFISRESVVAIWKALNALTNDPQAQANHKTRVETGQYALPALQEALAQLGYGVQDGILIPPGCWWDALAGQVVYPEA